MPIFLTLLFLLIQPSQHQHDLKGLWEVCESEQDCREESGGAFLAFSDSTAIMLMLWGNGLDPIPFGDEFLYSVRDNQVAFIDENGTDIFKMKWIDNKRLNLTALESPDTLYLFKSAD